MDSNPESESETLLPFRAGVQQPHHLDDAQACAGGSLGIVFVGLRKTEVDQQSVPEMLGNMPVVSLDDLRSSGLIGFYDVPEVFGIELAGKARGVHQVAEHHRELAPSGEGKCATPYCLTDALQNGKRL